MARGYSLQRIASTLHYHVNTIRYHVAQMREHYQFNGDYHSIVPQAIQRGILLHHSATEIVQQFSEYLQRELEDTRWTEPAREFIQRATEKYLEREVCD
jgi:hypothetical protein